MEFSVKEIAQILNGEVVGDDSQKINTLNKIEEAQKGSIAFLANPKYEPHIYTTHATAVIVSSDFHTSTHNIFYTYKSSRSLL